MEPTAQPDPWPDSWLAARRQPAHPVERSDYEDPSDRRMRRGLEMLWPIQPLLRVLMGQVGEPWQSARIAGKGVRAGPRQLSRLHGLTRRASELLEVEPPTVYVLQAATLEMTLVGTRERSTLSVTSGLMDAVPEPELYYLLARQMGHIKSEHVLYLTLLKALKDALGSAHKVLALPAVVLLHTWRRAATFSADRAGLLAAQDLGVACSALLRLALGSSRLFHQTDVETYIRDGLHDLLAHRLRTVSELFQANPYLPRRLAGLYDFDRSPAFEKLFPGRGPAGGRGRIIPGGGEGGR